MNEELQFTHIWDGRSVNLDLPDLWRQVRDFSRNPTKILEVGSFEGFSACKMIELFAAHNPIELTCIDSWEGTIFHDQLVGPDHEAVFHRNLEIAVRDAPYPVTLRTLKSDAFLALSSLIHQGDRNLRLDLSRWITRVAGRAVRSRRGIQASEERWHTDIRRLRLDRRIVQRWQCQ